MVRTILCQKLKKKIKEKKMGKDKKHKNYVLPKIWHVVAKT